MTAEINFHDAIVADAPATAAVPDPAPAFTAITVSEMDLERLIEGAQAKLTAMRAASFVVDNRRAAERELAAAETALNNSDKIIARFEGLTADALKKLDEAIEHEFSSPGIGAFGVPLKTEEMNRVNSAAIAFVGLKRSQVQHRRTRAAQAERLETLLRVQSQYAPKDAA